MQCTAHPSTAFRSTCRARAARLPKALFNARRMSAGNSTSGVHHAYQASYTNCKHRGAGFMQIVRTQRDLRCERTRRIPRAHWSSGHPLQTSYSTYVCNCILVEEIARPGNNNVNKVASRRGAESCKSWLGDG